MSTPTVRGTVAPATGNSSTSPAGTQVGDLVILILSHATAAGEDLTHTLQPGYTEITSVFVDNGLNDLRTSVAYTVATVAGAQSYTPYSAANGTRNTGMIVVNVSTFDIASLILNTTSSISSNPPVCPSLSGLIGDYLCVTHGSWNLGSATANTAGTPSSPLYTKQWELSGSSTNDQVLGTRSLVNQYEATVNSGNFSDTVATVFATTGISFAIRGPVTNRLGALNQTLGELTVTSTAEGPVSVIGDITLNALTASSTAEMQFQATSDITLGELIGSSQASITGVALRSYITFAKLTVTAEAETDWLQQYFSTHEGVEVLEDGSVREPV